MHWHEIRGQLLMTTGMRLEDVGIRDFADIVYAYAVNSTEMRSDFRSAILGYMFDYNEVTEEVKTFEGFKAAALSKSMLAELDAFSGVG